MGTWGPSNFENDAAQDWLYDFGETDFRLIDRSRLNQIKYEE